MTRLTCGLVIASSLLATHAYAESQAEIAARENEEGKQLMFDNKYSEASAKFMSAHSRVPEPKYFFNHCTSLFWEGKFGEALTACNAADKNADDKLKPKIAAFEDKIRGEAQKQNVPLEPVGGGGGPGDTPPNPNGQQVGQQTGPNGQPTGPVGPSGQPTGPMPPQQQQPYAVGRPPSMGLFSQGRPENTYSWSLGIDLYGGGGRVGAPGFYGHAASGFRVKGDYIVNPAQRIGAQGYFQLTNYSEGNNMGTAGAATLSIFDLGVAAYKHLCGSTSRICLTPLVGAQLALLSPNQMDSTGNAVFNYASLGARAEMSLQFMLGSRYQHVLQGMFGLNAYTGAFSQPSDCTHGVDCKEDYGLDKGGAAFYIGAGYTYRFNTPFGSAPFVTLE